jgi:hypothetical protein
MKGHAGLDLNPVEAFRYELLGKEMYRLISQNYRQYTTISGEPADWTIRQLIETMEGRPRLRQIFLNELAGPNYASSEFPNRVKELDPPELRTQQSDR